VSERQLTSKSESGQISHELFGRVQATPKNRRGDAKLTQPNDYVLGTHDAEIARLGLQHQVWRPHMLRAWMSAGMTRRSRVIDFGAGPAYATFDAAEIVGPEGEVVALERSPHFIKFAEAEIERRELRSVRILELDLMLEADIPTGFDVAWCRWVASFVANSQILLKNIFASLRAGGRAVLHEYQSYATWRVIPTNERIDEFVREVMASWRASGGEPDIAPVLIPAMSKMGFEITQLDPLIYAVRPSDFMWQWPAAFVTSNSQRLVDLGRVSQRWANEIQSEFAALSATPDVTLVTPMVMQIIAEKR
jgi:SAM-dependent methyltransferase